MKHEGKLPDEVEVAGGTRYRRVNQEMVIS